MDLLHLLAEPGMRLSELGLRLLRLLAILEALDRHAAAGACKLRAPEEKRVETLWGCSVGFDEFLWEELGQLDLVGWLRDRLLEVH